MYYLELLLNPNYFASRSVFGFFVDNQYNRFELGYIVLKECRIVLSNFLNLILKKYSDSDSDFDSDFWFDLPFICMLILYIIKK